MIIIMQAHATQAQLALVLARIEALGFRHHISKGSERTIVGVIGDERPVDPEVFEVLEGVERARAVGHDLTRLASAASFFVSRVDTEIDQRLDAVGSVETKGLRGHAAIANARLAHQRYAEVFASDRWRLLAEAGARPQRPLWASTGVKDPAYTDTRYVLELVTGGVTLLMTTQYLDEADELADRIVVIDHGHVIAEGAPAELKTQTGGARLEVTLTEASPAASGALEPFASGPVRW